MHRLLTIIVMLVVTSVPSTAAASYAKPGVGGERRAPSVARLGGSSVIDTTQAARLRAVVRPARPGRTVRLQVRAADKWRTIRRSTQGTSRIVGFVLPPRTAKTLLLRVVGARTSDTRRAVSRRHVLRFAADREFVAPVPEDQANAVFGGRDDVEISPDGRWVAMHSYERIQAPDLNGSGTVLLYDRSTRLSVRVSPTYGAFPSLSSGGRKLAYVGPSANGRHVAIWMYDRRTGVQKQMYESRIGYKISSLQLSGNARWLVFGSEDRAAAFPAVAPEEAESSVYVMNVRTGRLRLLAGPRRAYATSDPAISADGSTVVHLGSTPGDRGSIKPEEYTGPAVDRAVFLWRRGSGTVRLPSPARTSAIDPRISDDRTTVSFIRYSRDERHPDLYRHELATGQTRRIVDGTAFGFLRHQAMSGDGRLVYVHAQRGGNPETCEDSCIFRYDAAADSLELLRIDPNLDVDHFDVDRRGSQLVYSADPLRIQNEPGLRSTAATEFHPRP